MKILQIQGLAGQGGSEALTSLLSRELLNRGHDVIVAAPSTESKSIDDAEAAGCRIIRFKQVPSWRRIIDLRTGSEMAALVKKEKVDVVHSHIWNGHVLGVMAKLVTNVPSVATLHGPYITATTNRTIIHHLHRAIYRRLMRRMDRVIAISEFVKRINMDDIRLSQDQVEVVHNCSDVSIYDVARDRMKIRRALGLKETDTVFGLIGVITSQKGPLEFIKAGIDISSNSRNAKFLIVGEGPLRANCERMVADSGLTDHFIFTGYRKDVPEILGAIDALVVTSLNEGFGLTITEAMSSSLPVVAFDSGATAEIIVDGVTGFLAPYRDLEALISKMRTLIDNPSLRHRMGRSGLVRARKKFDIPLFVARTEKILLGAAGYL